MSLQSCSVAGVVEQLAYFFLFFFFFGIRGVLHQCGIPPTFYSQCVTGLGAIILLDFDYGGSTLKNYMRAKVIGFRCASSYLLSVADFGISSVAVVAS